jgi:putative heme-binding domain-containing protein
MSQRVLLFVICLVAVFGMRSFAAADRVPWTTSHLTGTPEPPSPYAPERVLHRARIENATELDFLPDSHWALILDQHGKLFGIDRSGPGDPLLIGDLLPAIGRQGEAYSLEFHPGFATNHFIYVAMWASGVKPEEMRIVRFLLEPTDPPQVDPATAKTIVAWPSNGHNGSDVHFGPDGLLYFSAGDAASPVPPDPYETGQRIDDFLSSVLRIDVDHPDPGREYSIPAGNPFVHTPGARPEVWAYGFRNPWKMSFDPRDGALWVGDVGWELWEMIFRIDHSGFNGGWSIVEGPQSVHPNGPHGPTPIETPVFSHSHIEATSITGGRVYRGSRLPELRDAYIYGDWAMGRIWALWWRDGRIEKRQELAVTPHQIVGFAEDEQHELYYLDYRDGGVYRLQPNQQRGDGTRFPRRLSDTGLFASVQDHQFAPGVEPFYIAVPMWNDHATAVRAVAFPGTSRAGWKNDYLESPKNAVLLRTISLEMTAGDRKSSRRIETQLLHFDGLAWHAYSYRWNADQTDADLVDRDGGEEVLNVVDAHAPGGRREQRWRFHARAECIRCHMVRVAEPHGCLNAFEPYQLASARDADGRSELERLTELGFIAGGQPAGQYAKLVNPFDTSAPLEQRARSYLHANCSHCHRPDAGGAVQMYWPVFFDRDQTRAIGVKPARGDFGIRDARIVSPGQPDHSALMYRVLTSGSGRMPIIGSREVDSAGTELLSEWIRSLGTDPVAAHSSNDAPQPDATSAAIRKVLIAAGERSTAEREALAETALQSTNAVVRDLFERFLPPGKRRQTLGAGFSAQTVLALTGDAVRGRELFFSPAGPQCFTCHQVEGMGRDFGPRLAKIGEKYSREQLLENIVQPGERVDEAWWARVIETRDGESHTGFVLKTDDAGVHLKEATGDDVMIPTASVRSIAVQKASLMPEGLLDNLTAQQAADLLAFLLDLKT